MSSDAQMLTRTEEVSVLVRRELSAPSISLLTLLFISINSQEYNPVSKPPPFPQVQHKRQRAVAKQLDRYKSMGNSVGIQQSDISESLREQYQIDSQTHLLHRATHELCTLRKITTPSQKQAEHISHIVEKYTSNNCQSISQLRNHYHADRKDYCNQEQTFFLIFHGANDYTLREEFVKRRFYHAHFAQQEIQQIIETYICGLKQYSHCFQREYPRLSLDCIAIDPTTHRIFLKDPWLIDHTDQDHMDRMTQLLLSYPSPEKLSCAYTYKAEDYNEFCSNLFSVGVIAMEICSMDFVDRIYMRKKQVDLQEIWRRLGTFTDQKLRRGVQCLLDVNPHQRKKVYQLWGIEKTEEHYLATLYSPESQVKYRQRHSSSRRSVNPNLASISSIQYDLQQSKFHPIAFEHPRPSSLQHNTTAFKLGLSSPPADTQRFGKMNMNNAPLSAQRTRISFSNQKHNPTQPFIGIPIPRIPPLMIQTNSPNHSPQIQNSPINKVTGNYNQKPTNFAYPQEWTRQHQHREPPFWKGPPIIHSPIKPPTKTNWTSNTPSPDSKPLLPHSPPQEIKWNPSHLQIRYH